MAPNVRFTDQLLKGQRKAIQERLRVWSGKCGGAAAPAPTPTPTATAKPQSSPTPKPTASGTGNGSGDGGTSGSGDGGTDRRYPTCREANAAGLGPYQRGVDPEYHWYEDRDKDGWVCER